jgi:hypothetical protein
VTHREEAAMSAVRDRLDDRLDIAEQRGLRVTALKVTWEELRELHEPDGFRVGVTNWWYRGVRLKPPPLKVDGSRRDTSW